MEDRCNCDCSKIRNPFLANTFIAKSVVERDRDNQYASKKKYCYFVKDLKSVEW